MENLSADKIAPLRGNVHLAHIFGEADLKDILAYDTAERRQAFVKELEGAAFMQQGEFPQPKHMTKVAKRHEELNETLLATFQDSTARTKTSPTPRESKSVLHR